MESPDRRIFRSVADGQTRLTAGLLHDRQMCNETNLFDRIDPGPLAEVYTTEHNRGYAEPEFCGKYIDTAVALWRSSGKDAYLAKAKRVVDSIIAHQRSDGYLGTYRQGGEFLAFGIWNAQFTIRGLLSYHRATGDAAALACACRGADYIVAAFTKPGGADLLTSGNQNIQHSCLLPDMVRLYEATANPAYLDFCRYIVDRWEQSEGLRLVSRAADCLALSCTKAAEMLICYQGLAELYRVTGEARFLSAAEAYWQSVYATQIGPSGNGSVKEYWHIQPRDLLLKYDEHPNENCVAVCWMKLSAMLLQCTGNARYADAFESTLYNHLLGSQAADGSDFSYYQPLQGTKVHVTQPKQYSCCRYRGMNMLAQLSRHVVLESPTGLAVNLYATGESQSTVAGASVRLSMSTAYPREGVVKLTIHPDRDVTFTLHLRRPAHAAEFAVSVDDQPLANVPESSGFVQITRQWSAGPVKVGIRMSLSPRSLSDTIEARDCVAVFRGPILLALDSHLQPHLETCTLASTTDVAKLRHTNTDDATQLAQYTLPGQVDRHPSALTLIPYAIAGSRDTTQDRFKVWIPIKNN